MNQYINPTFGRYQRPQTEMFMDHTYAQIHNYHLNQCHIQSYVQRIEKQRKWSITTSHHSVIQTDCVVLAQGCHNEPFILPHLLKLKMYVIYLVTILILNYFHNHLMSLEVVFQLLI